MIRTVILTTPSERVILHSAQDVQLDVPQLLELEVDYLQQGGFQQSMLLAETGPLQPEQVDDAVGRQSVTARVFLHYYSITSPQQRHSGRIAQRC